MRWPLSKPKPPAASAEPARPRILAVCCGRSDFTVGAPGVTPWFDGTTVGVDHSGPTLCCWYCGRKWGLNASGLVEVHPDALPPAWAMAEERRKAIEAEVRRRGNSDDPRTLQRRTAHGKAMSRPRESDD